MDTIFMNSENSKKPKLHVLILKLTILAFITHGKTYTITINLKYLHQH